MSSPAIGLLKFKLASCLAVILPMMDQLFCVCIIDVILAQCNFTLESFSTLQQRNFKLLPVHIGDRLNILASAGGLFVCLFLFFFFCFFSESQIHFFTGLYQTTFCYHKL